MPIQRGAATSHFDWPDGGGTSILVDRPEGLHPTDVVVIGVASESEGVTYSATGFTLHRSHSGGGTSGGVLIGTGFGPGAPFEVTFNVTSGANEITCSAWSYADPDAVVSLVAFDASPVTTTLDLPDIAVPTDNATVIYIARQNFRQIQGTTPTSDPLAVANQLAMRARQQPTAADPTEGSVELEDTGQSAWGVQIVLQPTAYIAAVLADSPLVFWPLDDPSGTTALDLGPLGMDGVYSGSSSNVPTLNEDGPGASGAILTNPQPSWMERANSSEWDFSPAYVFTIEAWVKRSSINQFVALVSLGSGNAYLRFNGDNRLNLLNAQTADLATGTSQVTDSEWHHVVVTSDGTTVRFYLDGAADGVATPGGLTGITNTAGQPRAVGVSYQPTVAEAWPTFFAWVAVYSSALDASRVAAHYDAMFAVPGSEAVAFAPLGAWGQSDAVKAILAATRASAGSIAAASVEKQVGALSRAALGTSHATSETKTGTAEVAGPAGITGPTTAEKQVASAAEARGIAGSVPTASANKTVQGGTRALTGSEPRAGVIKTAGAAAVRAVLGVRSRTQFQKESQGIAIAEGPNGAVARSNATKDVGATAKAAAGVRARLGAARSSAARAVGTVGAAAVTRGVKAVQANGLVRAVLGVLSRVFTYRGAPTHKNVYVVQPDDRVHAVIPESRTVIVRAVKQRP